MHLIFAQVVCMDIAGLRKMQTVESAIMIYAHWTCDVRQALIPTSDSAAVAPKRLEECRASHVAWHNDDPMGS